MNLNRILIISFLAVTGCQQKDTYDYFMLHPNELKKEFVKCQTIESAKCEVVMHAADDFSQLVTDQNNDPELMGQQIMQEQERLMLLFQKYEQAKKTGDEKQIQIAQDAYQDQHQKLRILYAVVATRGPE